MSCDYLKGLEFMSSKGGGSEIQKDQQQCFWPRCLEGLYEFCQMSLFLKNFFNIYLLAAPGLSCGTWDLCCGIQTSQLLHADFLVAACGLLVAACIRDLVPQPGIESRPPALGTQSLTHWATREVPPIESLLLLLFFWLHWVFVAGSRAQAQQLWCTGLVALRHVGSSWTRA